jgi:excisionase family DNA binding protein
MPKLKIRKSRLQAPAAPSSEAVGTPTDLMTIRDAMAFAKVSDATVRRWIRLKLLPSYKAGVQVRIDRRDLVKFLQS